MPSPSGSIRLPRDPPSLPLEGIILQGRRRQGPLQSRRFGRRHFASAVLVDDQRTAADPTAIGRRGSPDALRGRRRELPCRWFQRPVAFPVQHHPVGAVAQPVQRGGTDQLVRREGRSPFVEVQVRGQDRRRALIALGDQVMEVLVLGDFDC